MKPELKETITQTLKDCDCDNATINDFVAKLESGNKKDALLLLSKHRKGLLDQFHKCNDCIGYVDYLVAKIEKDGI